MIRWLCGVRLKKRISSEELNDRLVIVRIIEIVRQGRLRWFGHLERSDNADWVSACRNYVVPGSMSNGRVGRPGMNVLGMICAQEVYTVNMRRIGLCGRA